MYHALLSCSMRDTPTFRADGPAGTRWPESGGQGPAGSEADRPWQRDAPSDAAGADLPRLIDALPHLVWTSDADGVIMAGNARWAKCAGVAPAGSHWTAMLHPDERDAALAGWRAHGATGGPYEAAHRLQDGDGTERWMLVRIVPMAGSDDHSAGWCGTMTDIDALKAGEARALTLAHELTHRMQNMFAVVESLLRLSARCQPQVAEFAAVTASRIRSLAMANDHVRPQHGQIVPTTLHGLLHVLLAPFCQAMAGHQRVQLAGVDHPVGVASATLLALVIHELASNATKYGALSGDDGRVSISTHQTDGLLHLIWAEQGGPVLAGPPKSAGFGTLMTQRALRPPLAAQVEHVWAATGLILKISMPCERLAS